MTEIHKHRPWSAWERRAHPQSPAMLAIRVDNHRLSRDDHGAEHWIYEEPPVFGKLCAKLYKAVSHTDGVRGVVFVGAGDDPSVHADSFPNVSVEFEPERAAYWVIMVMVEWDALDATRETVREVLEVSPVGLVWWLEAGNTDRILNVLERKSDLVGHAED